MQVTIDELEPEIVDAVKRRAEAAGRSMEQELREIVSEAVKDDDVVAAQERQRRAQAAVERFRALRKKLWGDQVFDDGVDIIRKMRDERFGLDDPRWKD